ncbi:MAG: NAD(P)-binding domain-containing protein [Nakamurella sp.]
MRMRDISVGFVGVGTIASSIVEALLSGPNADHIEVVLSPRSVSRSADLAARHPRAFVAADSQAVVDAAEIVILAVLPTQVETVCSALNFRSGQVVVGLPAGWSPSRLGPLAAPATTVCQMIPLPMIALHAGPLVLFPRVPPVADLFEGCGRLIVLEHEDDIPILSSASAMMSSFFAAQASVVDWIAQHGFAEDVAASYVTALVHGLATEGLARNPYDAAGLIVDHETPGGLNASLRRSLESEGVFDTLASHLTEIETRLRS